MKINQLFLYPVKSLRGFPVQQAELTPLGLKYDRHWMIINDKDQFVTQRKHANMVLIHTRIDEQFLYLSKTGMPDIKIALEQEPEQTLITATIWRDECQVVAESDEVNTWLTTALDSPKPLRLVRMASNHVRPQSQAERFGDETTQFADAVAYLICNQASLDRLNDTLLEKGIEPSRIEQFRPNIVLSNTDNDQLAPFQEHQIKRLQHDQYTFTACDPCQRCIVPTVNIDTGEKHAQQEPYKTLVTINPMPDNPKAPAFGQNAVLASAAQGQMIKIDDNVDIII